MNSIISEINKKFNTLYETVKSIDANDINKEFTRISTLVQSKLSDTIEQAKTLMEKHIVEVPYDNETSKFSFKVKDNALEVSVESNDGLNKNTTSITIPEDVDVMEINQTYNPKRKVLVFKFGKKSKK